MSIYSIGVVSGSFQTDGEMFDVDFEREVHESKGDWEIVFEDTDPQYSTPIRLRKVNGVVEVLEVHESHECCSHCGSKKVSQVWRLWE